MDKKSAVLRWGGGLSKRVAVNIRATVKLLKRTQLRFLFCRHRKFQFQEPPFPLLDSGSERPGAVKGAPVLRGEANP